MDLECPCGSVSYDLDAQVVCGLPQVFDMEFLIKLALELLNNKPVPSNHHNIVNIDRYYEIRSYEDFLRFLTVSL